MSSESHEITVPVDLDGLRMVLAAAKETPPEQIVMTRYRCGTAACLVGNFCLKHPDDRLQLVEFYRHWLPRLRDAEDLTCIEAIMRRFSLSHSDAEHLFGCEDSDVVPATDLPAAEAIARLESFINNNGRR